MSQEMDRMTELACDRALVGLSPDGQAELEAFLGAKFDGRALDLEVAAAAVELAYLGRLVPLPAAQAEKAIQSAMGVFSSRGATALMGDAEAKRVAVSLARGPMPPSVGSAKPLRAAMPVPIKAPLRAAIAQPTVSMPTEIPQPAPVAQLPKRDRFRMAGWLAAAACLALAIGSLVIRTTSIATSDPPKIEAPSDAREALLARAKDVVRADWTAATDPTGHGVSGDVVWSASEQKGYMRFKGLAKNDPKATTYQLWIFDAEQDEKYPVDGGIFAVSGGDVIVPITAKLEVKKPKLFAITIEKPGGVVVSKRDRLVVTAAIAG
jgi:hypothetical protein